MQQPLPRDGPMSCGCFLNWEEGANLLDNVEGACGSKAGRLVRVHLQHCPGAFVISANFYIYRGNAYMHIDFAFVCAVVGQSSLVSRPEVAGQERDWASSTGCADPKICSSSGSSVL